MRKSINVFVFAFLYLISSIILISIDKEVIHKEPKEIPCYDRFRNELKDQTCFEKQGILTTIAGISILLFFLNIILGTVHFMEEKDEKNKRKTKKKGSVKGK